MNTHRHTNTHTYIQPLVTQRTIAPRVKIDRLRTVAVEASEQCERLTVPMVRLHSNFAHVCMYVYSWIDSSDIHLYMCVCVHAYLSKYTCAQVNEIGHGTDTILYVCMHVYTR